MNTLDESLNSLKDLDAGLRESFEEELLMLRDLDRTILSNVNEQGFAVYSLGESNVLFSAIHNGSLVPKGAELILGPEERVLEEDIFTRDLYLPLFLEHGGFLVTSHISRYFVDLNRTRSEAILSYGSPEIFGNLKDVKDVEAIKKAVEFYDSFYGIVSNVSFGNLHVGGHSMKNFSGNGDVCLIYKNPSDGEELKLQVENQGFKNVKINDPFTYEIGYFKQFIDIISKGKTMSFEFETNKDLYLDNMVKKSSQFDDVSKRIVAAVNNTYF